MTTPIPNPGPHLVDSATAEMMARELPEWVLWYRTERYGELTTYVFETRDPRADGKVCGISYGMTDRETREFRAGWPQQWKHRLTMNELAIAAGRALPFPDDATLEQRTKAFSLRDVVTALFFYQLLAAEIVLYRMEWMCRTPEGRVEGVRLARTGRLHKLLCPCETCIARRMVFGVP